MNRRGFFGRMIGAVVAAKITPQIETVGYVAPDPIGSTTTAMTFSSTDGRDLFVYADGCGKFYSFDRRNWTRFK